MPYIDPEDRERVVMDGPETPGELNFRVIELINDYIDASGEPVSYALFNEILGVLEAAKLEFYRRMVVPYEDLAMENNGDVFDLGIGDFERKELDAL